MTEPSEGYTQIPNDVLESIISLRNYGELKKDILLTVCRYTFGFHRERAQLSARFLARSLGAFHGNVTRAIKDLVKIGYLEEQTEGQNRTYKITIGAEKRYHDDDGIHDDNRYHDDTGSGITVIKKRYHDDTKERKQINKEIKKEPKPKKRVSLNLSLADIDKRLDEFLYIPNDTKEQLKVWYKYLDERKKKVTPTQFEITLHKIARLIEEGCEVGDVIERSITNGWQGLFFETSKGSRA